MLKKVLRDIKGAILGASSTLRRAECLIPRKKIQTMQRVHLQKGIPNWGLKPLQLIYYTTFSRLTFTSMYECRIMRLFCISDGILIPSFFNSLYILKRTSCALRYCPPFCSSLAMIIAVRAASPHCLRAMYRRNRYLAS